MPGKGVFKFDKMVVVLIKANILTLLKSSFVPLLISGDQNTIKMKYLKRLFYHFFGPFGR